MGRMKPKAPAPPVAEQRADAYINSLSGIGDPSRDNAGQGRFHPAHQRALTYYETLMSEDAIANRLCELPAQEMLRQGFRLDLGDVGDDAKRQIMAEFDRLGGVQHLQDAITFARGLGGAAVLLGADDGRSLSDPLDVASVREMLFLRTMTRIELIPLSYYTNPALPNFARPEIFEAVMVSPGGATNQQITFRVHESRLLRFEGTRTTERRRLQQQGWGESIFVKMENDLARLAEAVQGMTHAMADSDQAVFKLKGLLEVIKRGSTGTAALQQRYTQMSKDRSNVRAIALDADAESFEYVTRGFSGYDDVIYALMYIVSAASGIPVSLLFGMAPAGLNATGDSDITFFYDTIKAKQESLLMPQLRTLISAIATSLDIDLPDGWSICFKPLMQLNAKDLADVRLKAAQADQIEITEGVISATEARASHYGGDEYDQNITLDPTIDGEELVEEAQEVNAPPAGQKVPTSAGAANVPPNSQ